MIIKVPKEVDHCFADEIREEVDLILQTKDIRLLEFDFEHTEFMDSSGIGLIMGRYKLMKQRQGEVKIKNPSPNTLRVLKLAGMDRLAKIERNSHDESC